MGAVFIGNRGSFVIFDFPENPLIFNVKKAAWKIIKKPHKFPAKNVIIRDLNFRSKSQKKLQKQFSLKKISIKPN
jgi:hypothetical protein